MSRIISVRTEVFASSEMENSLHMMHWKS